MWVKSLAPKRENRLTNKKTKQKYGHTDLIQQDKEI